MLLNELTSGDLNRIAPEAVVVLPIGATEQHGPHLPVGTDTFAVEAVVAARWRRWTTRYRS